MTAIDTRLDLDIIEALDFEYMPPCESAHHGVYRSHDEGGAYALVHVEQDCGRTYQKFYCRTFSKVVTGPNPGTFCPVCGPTCRTTWATVLSYVDGA